MNNPLKNKKDWMGSPQAELTGFEFRSGSDRHTTGVNMWSDVFLHEVKTASGRTEKIAIILLDTQGLFDTQTSAADNSRIFALGTLISSIQIFNLNDVIQENQLNYLQMATDYAQFHTNLTNNEREKPFQSFLFLMRDWAHSSEHSYGFVGGKNYITKVLNTPSNQDSSLRQVREYIYNTFDDIRCFLMPHPGKGLTSGKHNGSHCLMDEEFKQQLMVLIEDLLRPANLVKKRILGEQVTGEQFGEYMKTFFETFQSPETPGVISLHDAIVERQLSNQLETAMKNYREGLADNLDYEQPEDSFEKSLEIIIEKAHVIVILWFKKAKKMGSKEHVQKFENRLMKEIDDTSKVWRKSSLETFKKMENQKRENQAKIDAAHAAHLAQVAADKAVFDELARKAEIKRIADLQEVQNALNLTQQQKKKEIQELLDQAERDRIENERKMNETMKIHAEEAERIRRENEEKMKVEIQKLKDAQNDQIAKITDEMEKTRLDFAETLKNQVQAQIEERKALEERWRLEDEKKNEEIEILSKNFTMLAEERKRDIARADELRRIEREENNERWQKEFELRKQEIFERRKESADFKKMFDLQYAEIKELQAAAAARKSTASFKASPNAIFTMFTSFVLVTSTWFVKQKSLF